MKNFEYIRDYYGVPAEMGRIVKFNGGLLGTIVEDRGFYIGVNFANDKPHIIRNLHPTWDIEYLGIGKIRKASKYQARYARYLKVSECFNSFIEFCRHDQRTFQK